jgi:RNA polymerase nonessential primary-like sigma factor
LLDKPLDVVKETLALNDAVGSVDLPLTEETSKTILDTIPDDHESLEDAFVGQDMRLHLEAWLEELSPQQHDIIARRFGFHDYDPMTLEEIGDAIGLTRERVRQIQAEALKILRRIVEAHGLSKNTAIHD